MDPASDIGEHQQPGQRKYSAPINLGMILLWTKIATEVMI
jgi:hypothetical protein